MTPQERPEINPQILQFVSKRIGGAGQDPGPVDVGSIDPRIQRLIFERLGGGNEEEKEGFLKRVGNVLASFAPPAPGQPLNPRQAVVASGAISGAILNPLEAVAEIPGVAARFFGDIFGVENGGKISAWSDKSVEYITRAREGLRSNAEVLAREAGGLTDQEISDAYGVGNFIGFIAPVAASVKGAQFLLRAPQALRAVPLASSLQVDFTAGMIFGSTLTPGDTPRERINNMMAEGAAFGVFRLIAWGGVGTISVIRNKLVRDRRVSGEMRALLKKMEDGTLKPGEMDDTQVKEMMKILNEEEWLVHSPRALEILEEKAETSAVMRGVIDIEQHGLSGGSIRGYQGSFEEVSRVVDRFKEDIPGVKFEALRGPEGDWGIYYGLKGLNNKQRSQIKKWGRYEGQSLEKNGSRYTLLSPEPSDTGFVKVKTSDGKITGLKVESTSFFSHHVEDLELPKIGDALFGDFENFARQISSKLLTETGTLTEDAMIRAVRAGTLQLDDNLRRHVQVGGAIVYPEELLIQGGDKAVAVIRLVQEGTPTPGAMAPEGLRRAMIHRNTRPGEQPWRITFFDEAEKVIGHQDFPNAQVATEAAADLGLVAKDATTMIPSLRGTVSAVMKEGQGVGGLLEPQRTATFDDLFDLWVKEKGFLENLPEGVTPRDLPAFKANFASRMRENLWKTLPAEDRKVFESVREEFWRLSREKEIPLESLAATKGFTTEVLEDGGVIIKDINTGAAFRAGNTGAAREALLAVERKGDDLLPSLIPWDSPGIGMVARGHAIPESGWSFHEHLDAKTYLRDINRALLGKAVKNVRDLFIRIEGITGLPIWSQGFEKIDQGFQRLRVDLEPLAREVQNIWKGMSRESKERVANFWAEVEGTELSLVEAVKLGRTRGLSARELRAFERSRTVFEHLYQVGREADIFRRGQYINNYYSRFLPWVEKHKFVNVEKAFDGNIPPEFQFWAQMSRTGELPVIEKDIELVMQKYLYQLLWKQHVLAPWENLAKLSGTRKGFHVNPPMKIKDLPPAQSARLLGVNPALTPDSPVLPDPLMKMMQEYLNTIRGAPVSGFENLRSVSEAFFGRLGMEVNPRILEEYHNIMMSHMYGAAMAARPILVMRNMVQNYWLMYSRVGSKYAGKAMEMSLTQEGFEEVLDAAAIRLAEAGIPQGDAYFANFVNHPDLVKGNNAFSRAFASTLRLGLRTGKVSKDLAQKMLVPYSSADQSNRAWAYFWQKLHTDDFLTKFEKGALTWDQFVEKGLPFFDSVVKEEFQRTYNLLGREKALRFIGKMAADESNFIYGLGATPGWMQGPVGRVVGMFGTWPMWALEHYYRRMKNGTLRQQMAMMARTAAMTGVFSVIAMETGRDLSSWMAPGSLLWTGGPFVEYGIDLRDAVNAPMDAKAGAFRRLAENVGGLVVPGQLAWRDFSEALDHSDPRQGFLSLMLGKNQNAGNWAIDWLYAGDIPLSVAPFLIEGDLDIPRPTNLYPIQPEGAGGSMRMRVPVTPSFENVRGNMENSPR